MLTNAGKSILTYFLYFQNKFLLFVTKNRSPKEAFYHFKDATRKQSKFRTVSLIVFKQIDDVYTMLKCRKSFTAVKDPSVKMIELIKFAIRHNWTLNCVKSSVCVCMDAAKLRAVKSIYEIFDFIELNSIHPNWIKDFNL